ncbi:molybdenum cofactor sulfurylase [Vibrio xiamenensis]|uniref:Molybdenum cofactor sulfurylase n=1 Tax=Vibrio xiamenensis TaxID=861298 RepID=A0A1G8GS28_9VIBR|nr:xanthine dehydrogenase accessory protein XdhC [Vibrio xiamenensis]SDH97071.1 molybdenum cofactor sulfurylase [Vibrio xiamenensis]
MSSKQPNSDFLSSPSLHWLEACRQLEQKGEAYCLATVVAYVGSVPRASGSKMVITAQCQFDTLGGGNLEHQVIAKARSAIQSGDAQVSVERFSLAADLGQCCGGAVQVMFEYFHTQTPKVVVFGAGHVCQALGPILAQLPLHLTVIDSRQEWLTPLQNQGIDTKHYDNPVEAINQLAPNSYIVVMTQDHGLDFELVRNALERNCFAFVGLIGSQGKKSRFEFRLKEQLSHAELLDGLTCPIGNPDIQGKLPMQVAVSIAAQLIQLTGKTEPSCPQGDEQQWRQFNQLRQTLKEVNP